MRGEQINGLIPAHGASHGCDTAIQRFFADPGKVAVGHLQAQDMPQCRPDPSRRLDGEVQQYEEKTQHQDRLSILECQLRQQQQNLDAAVELLIQRGILTLSSGDLGAEDLSGYGLDGFIDKPRGLDQFEALVEVTLQK